MKSIKYIVLVFIVSLCNNASYALVTLPSIFCDNMVLQQQSEVKIWGWAKPYEEITVKVGWDTTTYKVMTGNTMEWSVTVKTPQASYTPYEITIEGWRKLSIKNVLIGEVWLCSGQSNMEWSPRNGILNGENEISAANYPNIRFFQVIPRKSITPQDDVYGEWKECSSETMIDFSAIGYFFARELQQELDVPIGVIGSYVGGSPIETWIPAEYIESSKVLRDAAARVPEMSWAPNLPGYLYNAMIAPITKFSIKGFLWYQGEANEPNADTYDTLLTTLITAWRDKCGEKLPFYYAQIAPYNYGTPNACPMIQFAQLKTQKVTNTAMVVTNDFVDDVNNIHPKDKLTAAHRFANLAISETYGKKMEHNKLFCPYASSVRNIGNRVLVDFINANRLHNTTKTIAGFEVAGVDGIFYPAKATIIKDSKTGAFSCVDLRCSKVKNPAQVRYAWSNTAQPSLRNEYDLPASCFLIEQVQCENEMITK